MRYGVVVEELAVEVMAQLPDDRARQEVMALVEVARMNRGPGPLSATRGRWRRSGRRSAGGAGSTTRRTPERSRSGTSGGRADHFPSRSAVPGAPLGMRHTVQREDGKAPRRSLTNAQERDPVYLVDYSLGFTFGWMH
jgi:hypothetical protein